MSVAGFIKGTANFIVPVAVGAKSADQLLDTVAGNTNSAMRALVGIGSGLAYGSVAYDIATQTIPETWSKAVENYKSGHPVEAIAGQGFCQLLPEVAATGMLLGMAGGAAIRGFKNDSRDNALQNQT
jgi:hypothetical protein